MDQQTWTITFHGDSDADVNQQAQELKEILLDEVSDIKITQTRNHEVTQSGWDIIVAIIKTSAAVAAVNAISTWLKSRHNTSIEIEIKDIKLKAQNITNKNYSDTLDKLLKYIQENENKEK